MKNNFINFLLLLLTIEFCSFIALVLLGQSSKDFERIYYGDNNNIFIRSNCDFAKRLIAHPYLGFINNPECKDVNNIGLLGENVSYIKKSNQIRIGVFGGSVAANFAGIKKISSLEHYLNHCYSNHSEINYKVNNFSDGAWKYPHQVIALSLYKEMIDIAISIEGFNEQFMYSEKPKYDFSIPSNSYFDIAFNTKRSYLLKVYSIFKLENENIISKTNTAKLIVMFMRELIEFMLNNWTYDEWKKNWQLPYNINQSKWNISKHIGFLRDFESIANTASIPAIFVLQPSPIYKKYLTEKESEAVSYKGYQEEYETISKVMSENTSRYLDLSSLFSDERRMVFADSIHFLPDNQDYSFGNRKVAEKIAEYLYSEGIIKFSNECTLETYW